MKKNKLRDQDKNKINKIDQDQIMNLLITRAINYKNKNKNKKFNSALKAGASENKNEFKFNKNNNKSEAKLKKSNETDNAEKKKLTYNNCNYCEKQHSQSCFYKHSEFAEEK